ncbi:MAG: DUF883 domain-containing protein [Verrucomicrobiaceae bacterium]|nr:MAG: DUF883 domain-containing protein [Verrucomicrobiaceae bacterium]
MRNKIINELAQDAGALVAATKDITGEQVQEARKRVDFALKRAKGIYGQVCDKAIDGSNAVNELVHKNSYQAIAVGLAAGAILGYFIARGCKRGCPTRNTEEGA